MSRFRLLSAAAALLLAVSIPAGLEASGRQTGDGVSAGQGEVPAKPAASDPSAKPADARPATESGEPTQQKQPQSPPDPHWRDRWADYDDWPPSTAQQGGPGRQQQSQPPAPGQQPQRPGPRRYFPPYLLDLASKPAAEQERVLNADPQFRAATPEVQQRIREDLKRFTQMTPEERAKEGARWQERFRQPQAGRPPQQPRPEGDRPGPRRYFPPYLLDLASKPAAEQERVLNADPQFRAATPDIQRRIRDDLKRFTEMTPEERARWQEHFRQAQAGQPPQQPRPEGDRPGPRRYFPPYLLDLASKPAEEQERILNADPQFRAATPEVQQHIREDLKRFTQMTPEERARWRERFGPPPQVGRQPPPRPDADRPGQHRPMPPYLFELAGKPPEEQERILNADPHFRAMRPDDQRRIREDLKRISQMTPEERKQLGERFDTFHQLSPEARDKIRREIYPVWTKLSAERREAVSKEFRALREMKPSERQAHYAQGTFCKQFSPEEQKLLKQMLALSGIR